MKEFYVDASTQNNGNIGFQKTIIVVCDQKGNPVFEKDIGDYSINEGEVLAIIAALRDFTDDQPINIYSDSRIATNWANRGWLKRNEKSLRRGQLTERHKKFITYANELVLRTNSTVSWIPREKNKAGIYLEFHQKFLEDQMWY